MPILVSPSQGVLPRVKPEPTITLGQFLKKTLRKDEYLVKGALLSRMWGHDTEVFKGHVLVAWTYVDEEGNEGIHPVEAALKDEVWAWAQNFENVQCHGASVIAVHPN